MSFLVITFPGAGISVFVCSVNNMNHMKKLLNAQIISYDKVNQLRHVRYFKDKVIVVTGASSGIGLASARLFGSLGANVVMAARSLEKMQELSASVSQDPSRVLCVKADVSVEDDCRALMEQTVERFGRIDILVNNAGLSMRAMFADLDLKVLRTLMDVNFWGTVQCTKYALPHLLVLVFAPGYTSSNVRNAALTADGSAQGKTPLEEGKLMSAEECALHLAKALARRRSEVILTGLGKATVAFHRLFPRLTDRLTYSFIAREADSPFK